MFAVSGFKKVLPNRKGAGCTPVPLNVSLQEPAGALYPLQAQLIISPLPLIGRLCDLPVSKPLFQLCNVLIELFANFVKFAFLDRLVFFYSKRYK